MNVSSVGASPKDDSIDIHLRPALTIKRFSPLRLKKDVVPFSYQTIYGIVSYWGAPSNDRLLWSAGVGLGLGVAWFPFQRVSLSLRQGIELEFDHIYFDPPKPDLDNTYKFSLNVPPMQLLALFHF